MTLCPLLQEGHGTRLERQIATIRRQDRDIAVVLSMADYERLRSGNIRRDALLERVASLVEIIEVLQSIRASRAPKDDKFLEAAVNGRADVLVTGDNDLLGLNPFRGIAILSPADYLTRET